MEYVTYENYKKIYGDKAIPMGDFQRLSWEASRKVENAATGVDGVNKLKHAFPEEEDAAEAVKRCICAIVTIMAQIEQAEQTARQSQGYVTREDGTMMNKIVTSVSSGSESISYAAAGSAARNTLVDTVLTDKTAQNRLFSDTIRDYLSGVQDANGVNLLFMGKYLYQVKTRSDENEF